MAILHCRSIERRRTTRAVVSVQMLATGMDDSKHKFHFVTKTVSVSANGGVILLDAPLPMGQKFHLVNEFNKKKAACRIVSVRTGSCWGRLSCCVRKGISGAWCFRRREQSH
jgi:hypothetical protein